MNNSLRRSLSALLSLSLILASSADAFAAARNIRVMPSPTGFTTLGITKALPSTIGTITIPSSVAAPHTVAAPQIPVQTPGAATTLPSAVSVSVSVPQARTLRFERVAEKSNPSSARSSLPLQSLSTRVEFIAESAKPQAPVESGISANARFFEAARPSAPSTLAVPTQFGSATQSLSRPGPSDAPSRDESVPGPQDEPQQPPRQKFSRSLKVGLIAATVPLALTFATVAIATALGYQFHPNYTLPVPGNPSIFTAAKFFSMAAIMAPIAEEILFRAGLQGGLKKITEKLPVIGAFWLPAVLSSLVFVAVHETSDPVLFATRFAHSMILSWAFHKEGLLSSIAAHAFFNGLLTMPLLLGALLGVTGGGLATLALFPISGIATLIVWRQLRAQKADRASGKIEPMTMTPKRALLLAGILGLGFLMMPNPIWGVALAAYLGWAWTSSR